MFDKYKKLEISQEELAVIEAALHTQSKILNVQASAGGSAARSRLNEVKRVLAHVSQHRAPDTEPCRKPTAGWFGMSRIFG
ncbi:hypothetical protein [Sulfitobacter sp. MF3-043]|uniref:hypothetical protein n=1 Tax=Sulfitobacter sediminivivens TaxID=3252902 RepID=UPI0036D9FEBE